MQYINVTKSHPDYQAAVELATQEKAIEPGEQPAALVRLPNGTWHITR